MPENEKFKKWCLKENDLENLTPTKVRNLIIECFFEAQKQTFNRVKQKAWTPSTDTEIYTSAVGAIKLAFAKMGEDFDNPTQKGLLRVVAYLAKQAATWGTPQDIIEHHRGQIQKAIELLNG